MTRPEETLRGGTKAELRRHFLAARRGLSAQEVAQQSVRITDLLFGLSAVQTRLATAPLIHMFLPIQRQNEVDTWLLINRLRLDSPQSQVAVSITDTTKNQLTHHLLEPDTLLAENRWGVPEPDPVATEIKPGAIEMVFVPLLAFDKRGHRVGYGRGYYDRFLAECSPTCLKVGLSLVEAVKLIDDVEPTDVRLDMCVTPNQVHVFS
ncbi:5-formyltetrahydrofolate cyclo-ligase [Spirosoma taeanense]|uniref:5-formyltetrahydrofolate cyclo-ligase n=1 Tax=Spirosoma taeanense TaxID=2735870 RepID=A0A6M5YCV8_9BACT|nr:5-formyltetrahydrofolate cyclo-ligase [Spirosoma taeanense]QJW91888.1 5-formyltetrahydrofolate cyclo-ligase [Spirosoma taeanense]